MKASLLIWFALITVSLCAMIVAIGAGAPMIHLVLTGLLSVGIALIAIVENGKLRAAGASKGEIAASTARNMGFVYVWGAVAIAVTYLFLLRWHEWWHFFAAFAVAGALCLFFANTLLRDAESGRIDPTMMKIGQALAWVQLVGMVVAMIGMIIDGKLSRHLNPRHLDWAAQHVFFCGALALALISAYALWAARNDAPVSAA
ncbi:MAG: hypothetical protein AB7E80_06485 [Hyphomicrobiaceae bacterium]